MEVPKNKKDYTLKTNKEDIHEKPLQQTFFHNGMNVIKRDTSNFRK